jgi:hypothetical protein
MEKQAKHRNHLLARMWPKSLRSKHDSRNTILEQMDVIDVLAQLEDREQKQEFFYLTEKIREFGVKSADLADRLSEFLETQREWALYEALQGVLRQSSSSPNNQRYQ